MKTLQRTVKTVVVSALMATSLIGCGQFNHLKPTTEAVSTVSCSGPTGHLLGNAVSQVKSNLSHSACLSQYNDYYGNLLEIAKGDPGAKNLAVFGEFKQWSESKGLVSKKQSEAKFHRYFNPRFVEISLNTTNSTYNTCSLASQQKTLLTNLKQEMKDKHTGLLEVLGDKARYQTAAELYSNLSFQLEQSFDACTASAY
jgi:hypothetical protein